MIRAEDLGQKPIQSTGTSSLERLAKLKGMTVDALKKAEKLDFSNLPIMDADIKGLGELPNLKTLILSGTKITDAAIDHFNFPNLVSLDLSNTKITSEAVKKIGERAKSGGLEDQTLPNLRNLSLHHTNITSLDGLQRVQLFQLDISFTGVKDLSPIAESGLLKDLRLVGLKLNTTQLIDQLAILKFEVYDSIKENKGRVYISIETDEQKDLKRLFDISSNVFSMWTPANYKPLKF